MTTFILEIAANAGQTLVHPAALIVAALMVVALITGAAGRVAVIVEDARHVGAGERNGSDVRFGTRQRRRS